MRRVLLVGATGNFGSTIARAVLARSAILRVLVRADSTSTLASDISQGCEVTDTEDGAFDGVDTVISAVQGGPDVIIDKQLELLEAARAAGVTRFIPSDYSLNFFGLDEGENINSDWRREFARRAEHQRGLVEVVHVLQGCFLDEGVLLGFLHAMDLDKGQAYVWGDGAETLQFTTYADTAAYVAEAALDERAVPSELFVAGDMVTFPELVDAAAAGVGRAITITTLGTLADLDAEIAHRRTEHPADVLAWLPLMYWRGMLSGKGKPGPLANGQYPDIHPTGVRQFFATLGERSKTP